jgi:integrase
MARGLWQPKNRSGKPAPYRCRITYPDGTRRVVSTEQRELGAAREAWKRMQREAAAGLERGRELQLGAVVTAWLASREVTGGHGRTGCADDTRAYYKRKAARVLEVLGDERAAARLRLEDLEGYIRTRREAGTGDSTIHKELVVLRAALRRGRKMGLRLDVDDIWPDFRAEYVPRTRWLTRDELEKLCAQLTPDRARCVRFIALTGARDREWQRIGHVHVDLKAQRVTLPGTKSPSAWRVLPLDEHPELRSLLRHALLARRGGSLFRTWSNMRRDLHRACERAKIPGCSANDLRRTFATWLRKAGTKIDRIAHLLGHVDSRLVEKVYGKLEPADLAGDVGRAFAGGVFVDRDFVPQPDGSYRSELLELGPGGELVPARGVA